MPRALTVALAVAVAVVLASGAVAQADPGSTSKFTRAKGKSHAPTARAAAQVRARALKASGTLLHECDDPPDTLCGSIDVPLDRSKPDAGTIPIFFALVPHTDPGPAAGTILASSGGPGISTTGDFLFSFLFNGVQDERDLLLIDLRGTGRSGAIDCPDAQHGIGEERDAVRACGAQLGAAASRYGSADRADDIEAVRAALGIPKFDYYGISAGGITAEAYAARYGDRLRSVILDSAKMPGDESFFSFDPPALERAAELICKRSPTCSAADPEPGDTLRDLIRRVRSRPLVGTAPDADGQPHAVVLDERLLVNMLGNDSAGYLNHSEISAAARALEDGDSLPLLRLASENDFPIFGDAGDPRFFSQGDFYATWCTDGLFPWDETSASEPKRQAQYDAAAAALPRSVFAPFSVGAWLGSFVPTTDLCVPWPKRTNVEPAVPPGTRFPSVPTLAFTGDIDVVISSEAARAAAARFPRSQVVEVADSGHVAAPASDCTFGLLNQFIEHPGPVDARCAKDFTPTYALASFPRLSLFAPTPAVEPGQGDDSRILDRKVARMAWAAAYDGIQRTFRAPGDRGAGLRGGTFSIEGTDTGFKNVYDGARFAADVAVSGPAEVDFAAGGVVRAELTVDGPGSLDGALEVTGRLFPHTESVSIRGTIGGRHVAVLVPTTGT
jgi:pimeloyl-ACP methyl ester carboxylesterase